MAQEDQHANQLVPLIEQGNLVAKINSELASQVYRKLDREGTDAHITRASDMYISRYSIMGYVEYNVAQECIGGIVLVPKKLALMIQLYGEEAWNTFKSDHVKCIDLEKNIERLDDARHIGVRFTDEIYFFAYHPAGFGQVGCEMVEHIRGLEGSVFEFLKGLDGYIDRLRKYTPTDPASDFSKLQGRGFLMLGQ